MTTFRARNYSGAGVLILDTNTSSLLLIQDYTEDYNCCGGYIKYLNSDSQRLEKTARDELYEETRTLLSYDIDHLMKCPFVDVEHYGELFRCYILKIQCSSDICNQFKQTNVQSLPTETDYHETSSIALFPLKQFQEEASFSTIMKDAKAIDSTGNRQWLNLRVISVLRSAKEKQLL